MSQPQEQIHPDIEVDLEGIVFRDAVVDRIDVHEDEVADRQWLLVTEAARRAINGSVEARQLAVKFTQVPLNETLPAAALSELAATDDRLSRIISRAGAVLGRKLALEPVPDQAIAPDLRHSPKLKTREDVAGSLKAMKHEIYTQRSYDQTLEDTRDRQAEGHGITLAEQQLVDRRYRYARDIKLLGLGAELHDQPFTYDAEAAHDGILEHNMASGTQILLTAEALDQEPGLLDPSQWQSRQRIKDRVYNVVVGGKEYIMKERKTIRHMDTTRHGHRDTMTSAEEFRTAQHFAGKGVIVQDGVMLRWERPLGCVTFPDGYQFTMFEKEADLGGSFPQHELTAAIMKNPDKYQDEFEAVAIEAKHLYDGRSDIVGHFDEVPPKPKRLPLTRDARAYKKQYKDQPTSDVLTFEEFAAAKADSLVRVAEESMRRVVGEDGFVNNDTDDYAMRVVEIDDLPSIELISFDLEYYQHDPKVAAIIQNNRMDYKKGGQGYVIRYDSQRDIRVAAEYAMRVREGMVLPSDDRNHQAHQNALETNAWNSN